MSSFSLRSLITLTSAVLCLMSCHNLENKDILGLWQLDETIVDAMETSNKPTLLQFKQQNVFSISNEDGDMSGLYFLDDQKVKMKSQNRKWFNREWYIEQFGDQLILRGIGTGFSRTRLKFSRLNEVPDFQDFEDRIIGKWQIYKIRSENKIERPDNIMFELKRDGFYSISGSDGHFEAGHLVVNTRHKKLIFDHDSLVWNAWFYGNELRFDNEGSGIEYSLRKLD